MKKRRLNILDDGVEEESASFSSSKMFKNKSTDGVQATLNQLYKKGDKEKVDAQVAEFFYTSVFLLM